MFTYMMFILLILCGIASILATNAPNLNNVDASTENHESLNVILFLAHTDFGMNCEQNDGIAYLNISAVGKIKPCTMRPESNLPRSFGNIIQRNQQKECDCKKLLESSIFSLMGWARNAMGMTTAIVSLIQNEKVEENQKRSKYYDYKFETIGSTAPSEHQQLQQQQQYSTHNREDLNQLPSPKFKDDDLPILKREAVLGIPIINAFPHEPKLKFNNIHKYDKYGDFINVRRVKRQLIVEPEHTQVFEIDSTKEEPREILNIPSLERSGRPESIWDILGIMTAIRRSFFVNFFNPLLDPHQRMLDEENGLDVNSLGEIRIPSLFQLVQTTLSKLQEETRTNHANGYLVIIFGGTLSDISQRKSDLVQSLKHIQETTNTENTLVIVTGSCPENITHNNQTHHGPKSGEEFLLPVYAKGPNAELLSKAKELFDIPVQIKEVIEAAKSEENNNNSERQKMDLETINENSKFFDVNNMNEMENMFNNEWKKDIKSEDNNNQEDNKWTNMRMRRNIVNDFMLGAKAGTLKLIVDTLMFFVLFIFVFFL